MAEVKNPLNTSGCISPSYFTSIYMYNLRKQFQEDKRVDRLEIVFLQLDKNTELARAVDVLMTRAKRTYILLIKVNKLFSLFSS